MTESQAWVNAVKDKALELGIDGIAGALSGAAMSGVFSAPQIASDFNKAQSEWTGKNKYFDELEARAKASGKSMAELYLEDYENSTPRELIVQYTPRDVGYEDKVFDFGITQSDIDLYVEKSYTKENDISYIKYLKPSVRLIDEVSSEIDISEYVHALRDNDIRHINNSHGETTNEKYPITPQDIQMIPYIVENYDKVIVVKRKDGKTGLVYVKKMEDNLVYYLEQVTQKYGNESLLVNKQMIKTGMFDIPDLPELPESIAKKQSVVEFLNDLNKIPQVYVQDVYQPHSNKTITQPDASVKSDNADYYIQTDESSSQLPYTVQNDPLPFVTAEEYVTEEYREKTASNRAFTDDTIRYEGKARYIVERAIASGVLNDTEASHRLVDLAAKLYARTGVEFELSKTKDTESRTEKISYTAARENESTEDLHINSVSDDMITSPNGNVKGKHSLSTTTSICNSVRKS